MSDAVVYCRLSTERHSGSEMTTIRQNFFPPWPSPLHRSATLWGFSFTAPAVIMLLTTLGGGGHDHYFGRNHRLCWEWSIEARCALSISGRLDGFGPFLRLLLLLSQFFSAEMLTKHRVSQNLHASSEQCLCVHVCVQTSYVCPSQSLASRQYPHTSRTRLFLVRCNRLKVSSRAQVRREQNLLGSPTMLCNRWASW